MPHFQQRKMDLRNALWSERDRAVHQILTMVGGSSHAHRDPTVDVNFGFGHAQVKGEGGRFVRFLIQKLKTLDYPVYLIDEGYSSQFCVRCGS